jgi:tRNA(Ile)-lysidine synthase
LLGKDISPLNPFPVLVGEYPIKIPGKTLIPGWRIEARVTEPAGPITGDNGFIAYLDFAHLDGKLTVRPRQRGDRFQPSGMKGMKKVAQFMQDVKIPGDRRDRVPILADDAGILWVVGYRIAERVKITEQTKKVLRVEFERI